jgi:hypothetical protein
MVAVVKGTFTNHNAIHQTIPVQYSNDAYFKVGYSPYVNKAFVYISVFKILNFIRQLFIFSCFYSIINYQDTTIRLCKNIK